MPNPPARWLNVKAVKQEIPFTVSFVRKMDSTFAVEYQFGILKSTSLAELGQNVL
jgi:hypothetical protein